MNPKDSIFMKILNGDIPCHKVYEDDNALAFLDVYPHARGHTLVIPKQPVYTFDELTNVEGLFTAVQTTMNILKKTLKCDGFNVGWNNGKVAGKLYRTCTCTLCRGTKMITVGPCTPLLTILDLTKLMI